MESINIEANNSYTGYGTTGDGAIYAYWTSTTYGTVSSASYVWYMTRGGYLSYNVASYTFGGIRPVITIPKSIIS